MANWFDRALLAVSPKLAARRAYYREVARSYYAAADVGRRHEGWTTANPTGEVAAGPPGHRPGQGAGPGAQ